MRALFGLVIFAVFVAGGAAAQGDKGTVLIDTRHATISDAFTESRDTVKSILSNADYTVQLRSDIISSNVLKGYSVLVLLTPTKEFDGTEVSSILKFMQGGGGVLLIGESKEYFFLVNNETTYFDAGVLNGLSSRFGIKFNSDTLMTSEGGESSKSVTITFFENHSVASGLTSLTLTAGGTLDLSGNATKVAWGDENAYSEVYPRLSLSYPPVVAASHYGYGRAVAFTDTEYFNTGQGSKLLLNAVQWLDMIPSLALAEGYRSNGTLLLREHNYAQAKSFFDSALAIFTALDIEDKASETEALLAACETGLRADAKLKEGYSSYNLEKYQEAKASFEDANKLYTELGNAAKVDESGKMIATISEFITASYLYDEAMKSFSAGNYTDAKKKFLDSKAMYEENNDTEMAGKVAEMVEKSESGTLALNSISTAENLTKGKEFENAREELLNAKKILEELDNSAKAQEVQILIDRADSYINAYAKLTEGRASLEGGDYKKAKELFTEALNVFTTLGDQSMISEAQTGIDAADEKSKEKKEISATVIVVVVVVLALAGISIAWTKRQKKLEVHEAKTKASRKNKKVEELEEKIKKLNLQYTRGGISKKEYGKQLRELEDALEAQKQKNMR